jgi:ankyrin repeat protein
MYSAARGHDDVVDVLLQHGAYINEVDNFNETALFQACGNGWLSTVKKLYAYGASIDVSAFDNATPLYVAALHGYTDICEYLIEKGADPNASTYESATALYACVHTNNVPLAKILIASGADIAMVQYPNGDVLLHVAVQSDSEEMITLLLTHGANFWGENEDSMTAFELAKRKGCMKCLRAFTDFQNANIKSIVTDFGFSREIFSPIR